ncbi:MAG TPA: hypothetical protein VHX88_03960 [Solirubrobacteraceae bacterium]|jgi:hypothetical protein|nr:hypothetical protein [Solirubrobacteraceae bacterium]
MTDVLSPRQRRAALAALGRQRLEELLPLLDRLDEDFRGAFIAQLARVRPRGAPDAVGVAFARAALELRERVRGSAGP